MTNTTNSSSKAQKYDLYKFNHESKAKRVEGKIYYNRLS